MTLRRRLLMAIAIMTLALVGVLIFVADRQQRLRIDQIDDQLLAVQANVERAAAAFEANPNSQLDRPRTPAIGELYLATTGPDGSTQVITRPASQPELEPAIAPDDLADGAAPFTADLVGGGQARTVVIPIGFQRTAVAAISTGPAEDAHRALLTTAGTAIGIILTAFALLFWWVDRLGLRPIGAVTRAAEDVAAGRSEHRVTHPSVATEAGRLGAAFNTMLDARQAAEARQRRFVADASHELRTPITVLRGYTSLYADGGLTTEATVDDAMRRMDSEARRMSALVDDLLTLASLDDDRPLHLEPVDLIELLGDLAADAHAIQPERPIDTAAIAAGLTVAADRHQITQAFTTIVTNALHHTPPTASLTISAALVDDGVRIAFSDAGPGIDPAHLDQIFDRFHRADAGRSRSSGGFGLGLSIARAIVQAHHGTISAASSPTEGTAITITLPRGPPLEA